MYYMSYCNSALDSRDRRRIPARVLRLSGKDSHGNPGLGPPSPAIRPATGTASRRYATRLTPREYERTPVQRGGWCVESGLCLRSHTQSHLLVAGNKSGVSQKRFYRELIRKSDDRFDAHLSRLKKSG